MSAAKDAPAGRAPGKASTARPPKPSTAPSLAHKGKGTHVLGRIARASARHRVAVLATGAVLMAVLAVGIPKLRFEDNLVDSLPKGDPHTAAARHLYESFPGSSYASPVFASVDPGKWVEANGRLPNRVPLDDPRAQSQANDLAATINGLLASGAQEGQPGAQAPDPIPGPTNITDEVYMRGMEELFLFLQDRIPELSYGITLSSQVKLVNYTNTGVPGPGPGASGQPIRAPDPAAFSLPGTDPQGSQQFSSAWTTYYMASPASVRSIVSKDWTSTRLALLFEPDGKSLVQLGDELYAAVDAYKAEMARCDAGQACSLEWNVFAPGSVIVDPRAGPAAASHLTRTTIEDLFVLGPIAIAFVGAMLFAAFRRPGTVLAMTLPLSVAGFGVLGVFGLVGLPIHAVSLLVFPVLIGTGIDFGIHMATSYHHARSRGADPLGAAYEAGEGAGVPLVVVTVTTLVGMGFLLYAPNVLLEQLGAAIVLGLSLLLVVSLTCLPAALSYCSSPPPRRTLTDRVLQRNAAFWGRNKLAALLLVGLLVGGSLLAAPKLKTLVIGTPAALFPEGDRSREDFDASNERYFNDNQDLVSNLLVLEGPVATPKAMAFLADLEQEVRELPAVRDDSAVSIHFALNAWIQVRQGTAGAPLVIAQENAQPGSTFPDTEEGIRALLDEMFATPLATYATFFIRHPDYEISVFLLELQQPSEFEDLGALWDDVYRIVERVQQRHPDSGLEVHLVGASAAAYLFTAKELPYVQVASYLGLVATALQVWLLRRSLRDAITVSGVVLAAGLWWIGLLVLADIPLSIGLVVPVVILEAIGSDYALHLRYAIAHEGPSAWGTVGRAVWYSAITDIGAFLVFTQVRYGLLRDATIATVFVLACALVATLILVPALARKKEIPEVSP